jgi:hypothetical protein
MITGIIVWGSLIFAGIICTAYAVSPSWRKQIEQPKYSFHQQVQDFDKSTVHAQQRTKP